jgi:hypothetical protein
MHDDLITESLDLECAEEQRSAHLLVEWSIHGGARELVGIHCDNPRLASLEPWDCRWSCWARVEATHRG